MQGEEEFIRILGQGCRINRARSTWGSELCPVQLTGMVTQLCGGVKVLESGAQRDAKSAAGLLPLSAGCCWSWTGAAG